MEKINFEISARAIKLAVEHWHYVSDVISLHVDQEEFGSDNLFEIGWAYILGFFCGYARLTLANTLHYDYDVEQQKQYFGHTLSYYDIFHFKAAHEHGEKHRKQDDEKLKGEKNGINE